MEGHSNKLQKKPAVVNVDTLEAINEKSVFFISFNCHILKSFSIFVCWVNSSPPFACYTYDLTPLSQLSSTISSLLSTPHPPPESDDDE